ncbi:MAG: ABC transporter ATP-binding protein [Solobacterium sp.]|nr:ABC transporter ATP-binding protein [Solobacterium sp.]
MDSIVRLENLYKTYGSGDTAVSALSGVSFDIKRGEMIVILGSSGSGKSTLLNMIGGMDVPDEGSVFFEGKRIDERGEKSLCEYRRKKVGFVFQSFNLISELTALENVRLTASDARRAEEALAMVGLEDRKNSYPSMLSGGQQQRVSIARALAKNSKILLCDEPTGALDYETGKQILTVLEILCRKGHQTVVIVSHTQEIGRMADRVIRMRNGKIIDMKKNTRPQSAREIEW